MIAAPTFPYYRILFLIKVILPDLLFGENEISGGVAGNGWRVAQV
jgi:hypothetical protein